MPNGQLVEVANHKLHYYKKGENGPTVVFEAAFDPAGHLQWYNLQQEISKFATTISYDRSGILWSERGDNPKTGEKIAEELHSLLEQANVSKPYILVGHSLGGMLLRSFVSKYSDEVSGVILVDSQTPNDEEYLSPELYSMVNQGLPAGFLKFANATGVARLMFKGMFPDTGDYKYQNTVMPTLIHKSAHGVLEEQEEMNNLKKEANKIKSFGSIPLSVISAGDSQRFSSFIKDENLKMEMVNAWEMMQKDLLKLSTNSKQIRVPNSGHYINQDQPDVIIGAIKSMISETKLK
ncbi:hypothetical protein A9996_18930 [Gelidibacter algens]|nr:alpha/beta hydrolase [Gelidibacter algens]OBX19024.1 hypothetical protein A9996_18930 [Gelidibacter algens]